MKERHRAQGVRLKLKLSFLAPYALYRGPFCFDPPNPAQKNKLSNQ